MFRAEELSQNDRYADFNRKTIDLIVSEARNLAVKEMLPTQVIGDQQGVTFEAGQVTTPPEFKRIYEHPKKSKPKPAEVKKAKKVEIKNKFASAV